MVSGCDKELNAHFYSAASLKYHAPDTWYDTTASHIILTLDRPALALPRKSANWGVACTIFNDFGISQPRIEPVISLSLERHSTNWATRANHKFNTNKFFFPTK